MTTEFGTTRDGNGLVPPLPPGEISEFGTQKTPHDEAGSFLYDPTQSVEVSDRYFLRLLKADNNTNESESRNNLLRFTLPPMEMRLKGFRSNDEIDRNRLPTPLDTRGLVDVDALIEAVKSTVHPSYRWPGYCDQHHTLWPAYRYETLQTFAPEVEAVAFRNLAINKIWVPRVFHNWIHVVTEPPPVPSTEIMQESIEEWVVVRDFFNSVRETTQIMRTYERERMRRRDVGNPFSESQERLLTDDLERRLGGVVLHCQGLKDVDLSRWSISMNMKLHAAAGQIGDMVIRGWQRRIKDVRRLPELLGRTTPLAPFDRLAEAA